MLYKSILALLLLSITLSSAQIPFGVVPLLGSSLLAMRSTSDWDANHGIQSSFLNKVNRPGQPAAAWCSGNKDNPMEYVQAGSVTPVTFTHISIQGRADGDSWVRYFRVMYSVDGINWVWYNNAQIFLGNSDRTTVVTHAFTSPFTARAIRLVPYEYYGEKCLRWDVYASSPLPN
eukprot:gene8088-9954_t